MLMKTITDINVQTVREAFQLSKQGGTKRACLHLITEGNTIHCHAIFCLRDPAVGDIITLLDANRNEYVVDPNLDEIQYDDGTE